MSKPTFVVWAAPLYEDGTVSGDGDEIEVPHLGFSSVNIFLQQWADQIGKNGVNAIDVTISPSTPLLTGPDPRGFDGGVEDLGREATRSATALAEWLDLGVANRAETDEGRQLAARARLVRQGIELIELAVQAGKETNA